MAPWVAGAGGLAAKETFRVGVSETAQAAAQVGAQKAVDEAKQEQAQEPFKPPFKSPGSFREDMLGEIGMCFSVLRDKVEAWMRGVDDTPRPHDPSMDITKFMQTPLLKLAPNSAEMPNPEKVAWQAELDMWLAWAVVRDADYWKTRISAVTDGLASRLFQSTQHDLDRIYMDELKMLQPIADRLDALGAAKFVMMTVNWRDHQGRPIKETVLNINLLRIIGHLVTMFPRKDPFLGKVADVVKNPQKVLPALKDLPPIYKR
jgi:hypothetical protein